jgi:hypothetical protein
MQTELDLFTRAYITCALWSSIDDNGAPLDRQYCWWDITEKSLQKMIDDCRKFQDENWEDISEDATQAGHDFWLTRNGHGGFWDGDWSDEAGRKLTTASKAFGECDLYVGDDGYLHIFPCPE